MSVKINHVYLYEMRKFDNNIRQYGANSILHLHKFRAVLSHDKHNKTILPETRLVEFVGHWPKMWYTLIQKLGNC
jgi:hypothetical protein